MSRPPRTVKCPVCGKAALYGEANPSRPFCSERCRTIDLGAWAAERYRVPVKPDEGGGEDDETGTPRD